MSKQALIIVDLQPDFLPGGPLAVPEGDAIISTVAALMDRFEIVVATQDWHPREHGSFAANHSGRMPGEVMDLHGLAQILWPVHCVQDSPGAALVPELQARAGKLAAVFRKGTDASVDSYSGFFDNGRRKATGLAEWLRERDVTSVVVCGLALDYCVKFTALDARSLGFETAVVRDASRAVNLQPGDDERALDELRAAGVAIVESKQLLEPVQVIGEGRWLRLVRRGRWEYAQRVKGVTAAVIVAVTPDDELILIEQPRPAVGGIVLELPAGLIGDIEGAEDEAPELAAARELEEETGYRPGRLERVAAGTSTAGLSDERLIVYVAHDVERVGDGGGDEHEDIAVHLVPLPAVEDWLTARERAGVVIDLKVWAGLYFARRIARAR
ncbi:MAG TPA: bifunctional nicotinamidase/pyrazinamidase [Enhygromyxa sp.]|nr:bifunctional nicotinamidase/pyrazinamidase [Enhygromyxa sp.]